MKSGENTIRRRRVNNVSKLRCNRHENDRINSRKNRRVTPRLAFFGYSIWRAHPFLCPFPTECSLASTNITRVARATSRCEHRRLRFHRDEYSDHWTYRHSARMYGCVDKCGFTRWMRERDRERKRERTRTKALDRSREKTIVAF